MHKKDAPGADQAMYSVMELMHHTNNAFIVCSAIELLSGR
jgi:hypothetical protein